MDTCQQAVLYPKGLSQTKLTIYLLISVLGIIVGLSLFIYYATIKQNLKYSLLSLIYLLIGWGYLIYVEKETRKQEKNRP